MNRFYVIKHTNGGYYEWRTKTFVEIEKAAKFSTFETAFETLELIAKSNEKYEIKELYER